MNTWRNRLMGDRDTDIAPALRDAALPLESPRDLDPLMRQLRDARFVLLGEASHGTHEFYQWRADITRRLIEEKCCAFIAVEGDWPDCYRINRYIKGYPNAGESAEQVLQAFDRWPTWMWANREIAELAEWLREYNRTRPDMEKVGFYGLDVYSLWDSMAAVVDYLDTIDPKLAASARKAYRCFDPYHDNAQAYARATALAPTSCEDETVAVLQALRDKAPAYLEDGREAYYNAEQNALVARGAEKYYRAMVRGGPMSWNVRDHHMVETLERLAAYHGHASKAVVWEHNTHIGDARFTDMADAGMVNVGQLMREHHAKPGEVRLVGFGTYRGTVRAGYEWGAPMQKMRVPPGRRDSLEDLLHRAGGGAADRDGRNLLLTFDGSRDGGIAGFGQQIKHRAIGVVYDPDAERWGNYVPTVAPRRYDAFLFIDRSRALDALSVSPEADPDPPETWPSGM